MEKDKHMFLGYWVDQFGSEHDDAPLRNCYKNIPVHCKLMLNNA